MRWFVCHNRDCRTTAITRREDWRDQLPAGAVWGAVWTDEEEAQLRAALRLGDDVDALREPPAWQGVPAKHWHPAWRITMRADGHLVMGK